MLECTLFGSAAVLLGFPIWIATNRMHLCAHSMVTMQGGPEMPAWLKQPFSFYSVGHVVSTLWMNPPTSTCPMEVESLDS